jgi:hypothetical protein
MSPTSLRVSAESLKLGTRSGTANGIDINTI